MAARPTRHTENSIARQVATSHLLSTASPSPFLTKIISFATQIMQSLRWLAIFLPLVLTQTQDSSSWYCTNPTTGLPEDVKIGDRHTLCVTIGPGGNWAAGVDYLRYTFRPVADEYSRFHIPKSFEQLVQNGAVNNPDSILRGQNLTLHVAVQDKLSFLKVYYDPGHDRVYPFLTAIVDVDKGKVTGIAWDDGCVFCGADQCVENMYNFDGQLASEIGVKAPNAGCHFKEEYCNKVQADQKVDENSSQSPLCDIFIYVVWTGTDSSGKAFQSSSKRFSAFPPGRIQDRLLNSLPKFPDLPDWFN